MRRSPKVVRCLSVVAALAALALIFEQNAQGGSARPTILRKKPRPPRIKPRPITPPATEDNDGPDDVLEEVVRDPLPTVDPKTPVKDLLPLAPATKRLGIYLGNDLARVPELGFESAPKKALTSKEWHKRKGQTIAAALLLNAKKEDGFLKALLSERKDLAGLPFAMGDACRTKGLRKLAFKESANYLRGDGFAQSGIAEFLTLVETQHGKDRRTREQYLQAHVAAASQIMGGESDKNRLDMVQYLAGISRVEATRELARIAVFSPDKEVREAAIEALSVRRDRDSTEVLVGALRYPWPAVAENAARAIVKMERKDLMPQLVAVLSESDPRSPKSEVIDGKKALVARELVRINHHKSCLLCHAPADPTKALEDTLVAAVPLPSERLSQPEEGYNSDSNLLVRLDVTYLRQDFSILQSVEDSAPWPTMQRFDFVVRKRVLTDRAAANMREDLNKREPGELSPYHRSAVRALRDLTGRDFEARPEPWRKFLANQAKN